MKNLIILLFVILCSLKVFSQRITQNLNTAWEFASDKNPNQTEIINIPHTWNAEDPFDDGKEYFRGKGIYRKQLFVPEHWKDQQLFLKFEGSNQITTLFVNQTKIGEHRGGYTGFVFDITEALNFGEENQLRIEVDNSHHQDIPPLDADFNFYGGIYRDLKLVVTDKIHFETANEATGNLLIKTTNVSEEKAEVKVETKVVNHTSATKKLKVEVVIFNPNSEKIVVLEKEIKLQPQETKPVRFEYQMKNPQLWSTENPQLYKIEANLFEGKNESPLDHLHSNFGLRWFKANPEKGFFLNGKPLKLIGANRHQDFESLGNALPGVLHRKDYKMIKEMGANFIRAAHYPQNPEVYKICDELGLLVWSEIPVINDVTASQAYHDVALQMQREQILQFYNHPSIVMWGLMNEIFIKMVFNKEMTEAEKEAKIKTTVELAEKLEKETKKLDTTRLSVMALHENEIYNTTGIANIPDVIGWNLYFGWYSPGLENFGKFLDKQHQKYPNRPLFISEYGPGADVRIQTETPKPWDFSEAYQLKLHKSYLNQVLERDYVLGMSAWNFADFGSSFRQDSKPHLNQKGLVNFNRSPKDIYYYYQARLQEEPFVYMAGKNYTDRFVEDENDKVNINVFSNADEVNLSVNDSVNSTVEVKSGIAEFNIALPEGKYQLIARIDGASAERTINVHNRSRLVSQLDKNGIRINVGSHVNYIDPLTDEVWISDEIYSTHGFGYMGGQVFQPSKGKFQGTASDIQGAKNDPLFQTMREGIEAYKFDVEKGEYRVTLLFAEPNTNASEENIYNLNEAEKAEATGVRSFDIKINEVEVKQNLNLAREYGRLRGVTLSYEITAKDGILIEFEATSGKTLLSGIKLEKI